MIPKSSTRGILFIAVVAGFVVASLAVVFAAIGGMSREAATIAMGAVGVLGAPAGIVLKSLLDDEPSKPKIITAPQDADIEVIVKSKTED